MRDRLALALALGLAGAASAGCDPGARSASTGAASGAASGAAPAIASKGPPVVTSEAPALRPPNAVDDTFRTYKAKLPAPSTLSEGNGFSTNCGSGAHATYTLLAASAQKVPVASDGDLPLLVAWARDSDLCIRYIALKAMLPRFGYDENRLAVPSMHDVEHFQYHEILGALAAYLVAKKVVFDSKIFAGLMLDLTDADFTRVVQGHWEEDVGPSNNFQTFVEVDARELRYRSHLRKTDPSWPETTYTVQIESIRAEEKRRFVVTGASRVEKNDRGYEGSPQRPTAPYTFLPVAPDVAWFDSGRPGSWVKVRRVSGKP